MSNDFEIRPASAYPRGPKATWMAQAIAICSGKVATTEAEIPALLCWLEDYNWPGAHEIAQFLLGLGDVLVPHVKRILERSEDNSWRYWIIVALVLRWPAVSTMKLSEQLVAIAEGDDSDELHLVALEAVIASGLLPHDQIRSLLDEKEKQHPELASDLWDLRCRL